MAALDKQFVGSIPDVYQRYMVPLIFEVYADDLASRVAIDRPGRVLETAAGTGVLTRALARKLAADARIHATDLNPPMLALAAQSLAGDSRIVFDAADALALPFADHGFDVVACQFGVMFFPDKGKGYREARRVLKTGGKFVFNVWDTLARNEFPDVVSQALAQRFPDDPPRFMERVPHGYSDITEIEATLLDAGFTGVAVETVEAVSRASSARDVAIAFCQGTPLRSEIEARAPGGIEEATQAATDTLRKRFGDGPVEGRIRAHVFVATA